MQSFKITPQIFVVRLRLAKLAAVLPQDRLGVQAGLDEGTASARISRYERGVHEPNITFAQRLAFELNIPAASFYATDDDRARLILCFGQLSTKQRKALLDSAAALAAP